jgi:NAD(P)H-dependent FMN reductase
MRLAESADEPIALAVIIGSTREGRFGGVVGDWICGHAKQRDDLVVDVIDLADTPLPATMPRPAPPEVTAYSARIAAADAFVVVTPEYNHSFPGPLKIAIDAVHGGWAAKPVGLVGYGGMSGGLRAIEHLRAVFAELHAVTVRDTVSFHGAWNRFDEHGRPHDEDGCGAAATVLLDQVVWWARALREARARRPYAA